MITKSARKLWASGVFAAYAFIAIGACDSGQFVSITDYTTSCAVDTDCIAVVTGNVCKTCCPNVAINRVDQDKLQTDTAAVQCDNEIADECDCAVGVVFCNKGQCDLRALDGGR